MAVKIKAKTAVKRKPPVRRKRLEVVPRALSYGDKLVGLTFNPSGDPTVLKLKTLYAEIIDTLAAPILISKTESDIRATAISEAMTAQMWAVKSATWRP